MRRLFYLLARILGDINAVSRGKIGQRIVRKQLHKSAGKAINKLLK